MKDAVSPNFLQYSSNFEIKTKQILYGFALISFVCAFVRKIFQLFMPPPFFFPSSEMHKKNHKIIEL